MRARLEGDHSNFHCGSAAVWAAMNRILESNGWQIVGSKDEYDALILNGEGSMHHSSQSWRTKMRLLAKALDAGKRAYLVNSVWQENSAEFDGVLRGLTGIWLRETLSRDDLLARHGIEGNVAPDLSFFHHERPAWRLRPQRLDAATTDFYSRDLRVWVSINVPPVDNLPKLSMAGRWGDFVATLKRTQLLITGRHHAVYGACQARTPFLAIDGNTHKISGLVAMAGVNIPVFRSFLDLRASIPKIGELRAEYDKLFDWMERQKEEDCLPQIPG